MMYQGKAVEVISQHTRFGTSVSTVRILSNGDVVDVLTDQLCDTGDDASLEHLVFSALSARIRNEIAHHNLLAPLQSNVVPLPHQVLALEKVISGAYLRFLMADEVGMGKTIEAGLVLKELKLRGIVKRTLVIVPLSAMGQWANELKSHFGEVFHVYDTNYIGAMAKTLSMVDVDNELNFWTQHNQIIVPMDALRPVEARQGWSRERTEKHNRYRIQSVLEAEFDLLIIDECHKVGGSDQTVGRYQMAQMLAQAVPNVLLLSATPHRGKSDHFRRILGLLDSDAFSGEGMPTIPELEPYVIRTEKRQAIDYDGKPLFNHRFTERVVARYDSDRHSRQQALFDNVTKYVVKGFNASQRTRNSSYGFVMVLFQRMMSSSTQAILDAMQKRMDRLLRERSESDEQVGDNGYDVLERLQENECEIDSLVDRVLSSSVSGFSHEIETLRDLVAEARNCIDHELDVKLEYLVERMAQLRDDENDPDLKFLIFTEFTSTQRMLDRELSQRAGYTCVTINGNDDSAARTTALIQFKESHQVLISTDAAGESLNMQFAHVVINYDLPWNPMILEQRIGRVDRIGQTHHVKAFNLMIDNSIDARVYEVIEHKLDQIMIELGINKTADVLDSTLEPDTVNKLFMTSLLDPSRFEGESNEWLEQIRQKLMTFRATEGSLPTTASDEIRADKVESIRYSPLPQWIENLTKTWLKLKGIQFETGITGIRTAFPGNEDNWYTFDTKVGLDNPLPDVLTLQHPIIQEIMDDGVPHLPGAPIHRIIVDTAESPEGYFLLWQIRLTNGFEFREEVHPIFITEEGESYHVFAQSFWSTLTSESLSGHFQREDNPAIELFQRLQRQSEDALANTYQSLLEAVRDASEKMRANKMKAFRFQMKQVEKIGIETIRKFRQRKYQTEFDEWNARFEVDSRVIPEFNCLLAVKVCRA